MKFASRKRAENRKRQIKSKPFHYDSLDTIPKKLFIRILQTEDLSLLSNVESDPEELQLIWDAMYEKHMDMDKSDDGKRVFRIVKTAGHLESKYAHVLMCVEALEWEVDDEIIEILRSYGYRMRDDNNDVYHEDLNSIKKNSESLMMKSRQIKKMLPKVDENQVEQKYTIDDVMASYSVILGFNIGDFNKVTYMEFEGFSKQVDAKIKSMKANQPNTKK